MPAVLPLKMMEIAKANDPKAAIFKALGPALDAIEVAGAQLLVATYIPPEKQGSIYMPEKTQQEALYQGSVGLLLKKGPWAFENDENLSIDWKGQNAEVGEWIIFRYSSTWEQHLNGVSVRFLDDRDMKGKVKDPKWLTSKPLVVTE